MGCDYYTDENGDFEMVVSDYETGRELKWIVLSLKKDHPLSFEVLKGRAR